MKKCFTVLFLMISIIATHGGDFTWPFLDNKAMGSYDFIKSHPEYDGRGVVIFIVDCGLDPAIPGLLKTSTGETKVIDVQDFSEQLVLSLSETEKDTLDSETVLSDGTVRLRGWEKLELKPADDIYYIGHLNEEDAYKNSDVTDINSNGKKNDQFGFIVFKIDNGSEVLKDAPGFAKVKEGDELWVYYVDEDGDGNIDDEKPRYDYKYNFDTFNFHNGEKDIQPLLTMTANIDPAGPGLIINTCDGSHGTHCGGIAAGYRIFGNEGNDGIAPGAYVVSLKIGDNVLSGGATTTASMKKAYEYGVEFMKEAGFKYAVFSMSYGIGSETPGKSGIEKFLNKFAFEHPEATIVTSNGNEGPGINSTGNPAGAEHIISAGALITPQTLKDLYGSPRTAPWITYFSSRGGESGKPDVVAPGGASSTVPAFSKGDVMWGTSMACPEVAGACAILLSAALKENLNVNSFLIKKAVKFSAKPVSGYTSIDYGNGMVNIPAAYNYLKILAGRNETRKALDYKVETKNTFYPDKHGAAAFWKANGYFPGNGEKQKVTVTPKFSSDIPATERENFYRVFSLKSSAPWLKTDKSQFYLRGTKTNSFGLFYDNSLLRSPGLYTARISAFPKNEKSGGFADFDLQASVVIPHRFSYENSYRKKFGPRSLTSGNYERVFVEVPPGATAMNVKMTPVAAKWYNMKLYLFSPDGYNPFYDRSIDNKDKKTIHVRVDESSLQRGIWELIPYCYYQSRNTSHYNLDVSFYSILTRPDTIAALEIPAGENPKSGLKVMNQYNRAVKASIKGSIKGYAKTEEYTQKGKKTFRKKIKIGKDISKMKIHIDMPTDEYNKVTDLAINIYDKNGHSVESDGMGRKYATIDFAPPAPGEYDFEMVMGFTSNKISNREFRFTLEEKYFYSDPISIKIEKPEITIHPGIWYDINFELTGNLPLSPDKHHSFGHMEFSDKNGDALMKKQIIYLK